MAIYATNIIEYSKQELTDYQYFNFSPNFYKMTIVITFLLI